LQSLTTNSLRKTPQKIHLLALALLKSSEVIASKVFRTFAASAGAGAAVTAVQIFFELYTPHN